MQDLRLAIRSLRATPVVSIVAALSLALGIGANTAIFSLVNSLLLRTLPVENPGRLVVLNDTTVTTGFNTWTYAIWDNVRQRTPAFDGALAWSLPRFNLAAGGEQQPVEGLYVSGQYFSTLGVPALIGRTITDADDVRGGGRDGAVAVISYPFWQRQFAGAADAVGRSIVLDRVPFTIVGVTPPDFAGTEIGRSFEVAVPFGTEPLLRGQETNLDRRSSWWITVMLRLKPGQTIEAATTAIRGVQPQIREAAMPQDWLPRLQATFLKDAFTLTPAATGTSLLRNRYQRPLLTILVVVALVLLVACANIANLLLARATARRHELSVRLALGASRWRLARQLLVESLVLSAAGALLGLLFASWVGHALVAQLSTQINRVVLDLALDWRVLGFTAAVTMATALLFGVAPAFRAARVAPIDALKEHGRSAGSDGRASVSSSLVVAQVALSLVLVVAAGLFVRSFSRLANVRLGFDRDQVLVVNVNAQRSRVQPEARTALFQRLADAVAALPGVAHAAGSVVTPLSNNTWGFDVTVPGAPELPKRDRNVLVNMVTPGWFATYGTRIVAGRDIEARDTTAAPHVALVNEAFARRFFPGRTAVGGVIEYPTNTTSPPPPSRIVGVVEDAVYRTLREPVRPTLYQPLAQYDPARIPLPRDGRLAAAALAQHRGVAWRNRSRSDVHVPAAGRSGPRRADSRAHRRLVVGLLRRPGAPARGARPLRRDGVCGQPEARRNRDPSGAWRRPIRRRPSRAGARDDARRDRRRGRHRHQPVGVDVRVDLAVRPRPARHDDPRRRRADAGRRRRIRRLAAGASGGDDRSCGGPPRELT